MEWSPVCNDPYRHVRLFKERCKKHHRQATRGPTLLSSQEPHSESLKRDFGDIIKLKTTIQRFNEGRRARINRKQEEIRKVKSALSVTSGHKNRVGRWKKK